MKTCFERSCILIPVLLLALALRLAPWGHNRFLEDEALYAYWGLQIVTGADPMLDSEPVDKPPLQPYTLALSFLLTAPPPTEGIGEGHEAAARLPSLLASLVGIALTYALGRQLSGDAQVGLLAAGLLALSPFDILFASTAFTDPLMTAWVLAALLAAARGWLGAAGLLAGLAAATKQQGLLFLPLVVALGLLSGTTRQNEPGPTRAEPDSAPGRPNPPSGGWQIRRLFRGIADPAGTRLQQWLRFALGLAAVAGGALGWDAARLQRPGFFQQSLISYGGLRLAAPAALGERGVEWLRLVGGFWVSPWLNGLLIAGLVVWLAGGRVGWWAAGSKTDWALGAFVVCFLLLHWLVGFQVWDRYLLALLPLLALLVAQAFGTLGRAIRAAPWRPAYTAGLGLVLLASLAGPALQAARSDLPLGGDHGAYDGIDELAAYLRTHAPPGAVLYHHWLGYHYRFYLYGAPLRLHWYPDLVDLAHDATIYRREPRYIAFPSWRDSGPAVAALAKAGMGLLPVLETVRRNGSTSFRLYRLEGP